MGALGHNPAGLLPEVGRGPVIAIAPNFL
jgi:hypothetical protein